MRKNSGNSLERIAYQNIKTLLSSYKLAPGQRLMYQDLANMFSVSRTPVKNALSRLEQEGYVTLIPEKGYIVKEISPQEAAELLDVLETLEVAAVKKLVNENPTKERLRKLKNLLDEYSRAVGRALDKERFIIDTHFHTKIVELSDNKFLTDLVTEIFEKIYLQIRISGLSQRRGSLAKKEHEKVYRAIEEGDLREAIKWIRTHARNRKNNILRNAFSNHYQKKLRLFLRPD